MNNSLVYCLPFSYFYRTRLTKGSISFHLMFEWAAAALLAILFGAGSADANLTQAFLSYLAFISLYEIGYLANDRLATTREENGRGRGAQNLAATWIPAWVILRLGAFAFVTWFVGAGEAPEWWGFFGSLCVVFTIHNLAKDRELRVFTFVWLAWFRFMAPIFWVVGFDQLLGIGLAAAMVYVIFRQLGYLDGKGLLAMPGRQRARIRLTAFALPLATLPAFLPLDGSEGLVVLIVYFASIGIIGSAASAIRRFLNNSGGPGA